MCFGGLGLATCVVFEPHPLFLRGQEGVKPDLYDVKLGKDMLLLCSDGISDTLKDAEIQARFSCQ